MRDFESYIMKFIEENIGEYDEIHCSKYLSDRIECVKDFIVYDGEQSIVGDTYIGDLLIKNKLIGIYYNMLYDYDDIEFKINNYEVEYEK